MTLAPAIAASQRLADRLTQSTIHALELYSIYLGTRLGLYQALRTAGTGLTAPELADRAGIAERYAREWLEQQAVAGLLHVDHAGAPPLERRYTLPAEHIPVLADHDDPAHMAPMAEIIAGIGGVLPLVADAYRAGTGVPYEAYGADFRHGQAGVNRPVFLQDLTERWLPAMPDVQARLLEGGRVRIADVGCGVGWSTIALARAYPNAEVIGYDTDAASIAEAARYAEAHGVVAQFLTTDATGLADEGPFDLVLLLEALHDMSQPADVLKAIRRALAPGGTVIVADEKVAERFYAPGDEIERLMYGWSVVHCLPAAMTDATSTATGTAIRPETVMALAARAGFRRIEVLPVDAGFFRLYRLDVA